MAQYHINPETGRAGQCKAKTPESCKFSVDSGTVVAHYDSKEDAKAAYERLNENKTLKSVNKNKTSSKPKTNTLQENRVKIAKVNSKVNTLTEKLQKKKFKIMDLNKSLSLDKSKEERDKIYEEIKQENEDSLIINKQRKDALKEQQALAWMIEKEEAKTKPKTNSGPLYYDGGPCGGARAC